jgi:hypothetical protein
MKKGTGIHVKFVFNIVIWRFIFTPLTGFVRVMESWKSHGFLFCKIKAFKSHGKLYFIEKSLNSHGKLLFEL